MGHLGKLTRLPGFFPYACCLPSDHAQFSNAILEAFRPMQGFAGANRGALG